MHHGKLNASCRTYLCVPIGCSIVVYEVQLIRFTCQSLYVCAAIAAFATAKVSVPPTLADVRPHALLHLGFLLERAQVTAAAGAATAAASLPLGAYLPSLRHLWYILYDFDPPPRPLPNGACPTHDTSLLTGLKAAPVHLTAQLRRCGLPLLAPVESCCFWPTSTLSGC